MGVPSVRCASSMASSRAFLRLDAVLRGIGCLRLLGIGIQVQDRLRPQGRQTRRTCVSYQPSVLAKPLKRDMQLRRARLLHLLHSLAVDTFEQELNHILVLGFGHFPDIAGDAVRSAALVGGVKG